MPTKRTPLRKVSTTVRNRIIRNEADLLQVLETHESSEFIYRGENSASYKLRPKVGRFNLGSETDSESLEHHVLSEFSRRSVPFLTRQPVCNLEWMALAQHHGLATRLLDWTSNLFVATYFAVQDYLGRNDRVIYALATDGFELLEERDDPFASKRVTIYEPAHLTPRVSAQMGLFTVHPFPCQPFAHPRLERWTIKGECVIRMNITLDRLGFNAATLFPGLDGLAKQLNSIYVDDHPDAA